MAGALEGKGPVVEQVLRATATWFPAPRGRLDPKDLPASMQHLAGTFVHTGRATGCMWLDYSPESVMRLDDYIAEHWPERPKKNTFESMIPTMGAYLGEVLARQTGACWVKDKNGYGLELRGSTAYPMTKVGKRFEMVWSTASAISTAK